MNKKAISEHKVRLSGERGLLVAVVLTAVEDALKTPEQEDYRIIADAKAYFAGRAGQYWAHLERLGLQRDLWPAAFNEDK